MAIDAAPRPVAPRPGRRWTQRRDLAAGLTLNRVLALGTVLLLAMRIQVSNGLTVGFALAIALIPVWWPVLPRFRGATWLMSVAALAVGSGVWLGRVAAEDHRVSQGLVLSLSIIMVGTFCGVGVLLWARTLVSDATVGIAFGAGLVLSFASGGGGALFSTNAWRFGLSIPLTVLGLALAVASGRRWVQIAVLLLLAAVSALNDARSSFAILLLAAIVMLWVVRPTRPSRRASATAALLTIAAVGVVIYNLGQALILEGYLGEATRARSERQLELSGSLLLGARPELGATMAMVQHRPLGYGSGVLPNLEDVLVAKTGMAELNYDPNNGYVERYMFGDGIELHSLTADFWAHFGLAGVLLAGTVLVLSVRWLGESVARRTADGLLLYLVIKGVWNLFFSPLYSSVTFLTLALGLLILRREPAPEAVAGPPRGRRIGGADG